MSTVREPGVEILIHLRWVTQGGELTPALMERLVSYLTRYADTLDTIVHAVGGVSDHLHLLIDLSPNRSLDAIRVELQKASARFVREAFHLPDFMWQPEWEFAMSIAPWQRDEVALYIQEQPLRHEKNETITRFESLTNDDIDDAEAVPEWLREALTAGGDA